MESKLSQMQKWTCFICQKPPLSIESLERQEKSGVIIYIDWDYRYESVYLHVKQKIYVYN